MFGLFSPKGNKMPKQEKKNNIFDFIYSKNTWGDNKNNAVLEDYFIYNKLFSINKNDTKQRSYLFYTTLSIRMLREYQSLREALSRNSSMINKGELLNWEIYRDNIDGYEEYLVDLRQNLDPFLLVFFPITPVLYVEDLGVSLKHIRQVVGIETYIENYTYNLGGEEKQFRFYNVKVNNEDIDKNLDFLLDNYYKVFWDFINKRMNKTIFLLGYAKCELSVFKRFIEMLATTCVMYNMFTESFFVAPHPLYEIPLYDKVEQKESIRLSWFYEYAFYKAINERLTQAVKQKA